MAVEVRRTALVIGASGGLGSALCQALKRDDRFGRVLALSRQRVTVADVNWYQADTTCSGQLEAAAQAIAATHPRLHLLINTTGMLADGDQLQPEKTLRDLRRDSLLRLVEVNAFAPLAALSAFSSLLRHDEPSQAVVLSAMVGSISDNRLGGWYSYRMSKAALNMGLRSAAIEFSRMPGGPSVVALHPGTTQTELSRPFLRKHVSRDAATSAAHILTVIRGLRAEDNGKFFNWDGRELSW